MGFPSTIDELRQRKYKFEGESQCKGCGDDIEWWETPNGKKIPMDHGTATPHWSTCPNARDFKADTPSTSKVTTATLNMDWIRAQAKNCYCTVCNKISGRS
jgi:hypothetical protein